jgi:hypothetical protein
VKEVSAETSARAARLHHEYWDGVREELTERDPATGYNDWSDFELQEYLRGNARLAYNVRESLNAQGRGEHDLTEELIYGEDCWEFDVRERMVSLVAKGFGAGLDIPLGYIIDRYHVGEEGFLADLTEYAYQLRDRGAEDSQARDTAKRIFTALMRSDVEETCRGWMGKDGRARLQERLHSGGY